MDAFLQLLHKPGHGLVTAAGRAVQVAQTAGHFQHFKLRAAAAVAAAKGEQAHRRNALFHNGVRAIGDVVQRFRRGADVGAVEVRKHLCSIHALPVERGVGEAGGIVPGHFGGQEIIHAAALHNLGNGKGVTEGIRQPEAVGGIVEILAGKALAPQELAHHVLAAGQVAVAFHPYAAVGLVAAFGHRFLDAGKQLGIVAADDIAVIGGGLHEQVFGVFLHQVQLIGVGAGAFLFGLADGPEPGGIHVAVADQAHPRSLAAVGAGKLLLQDGRGGAQRGTELLLCAAVGIVIQLLMRGD